VVELGDLEDDGSGRVEGKHRGGDFGVERSGVGLGDLKHKKKGNDERRKGNR